MAEKLCPARSETGRRIPGEKWVDYYHCDHCHTSWLIDRRHRPPVPILIATPKRDRRKPPRMTWPSINRDSVREAVPCSPKC